MKLRNAAVIACTLVPMLAASAISHADTNAEQSTSNLLNSVQAARGLSSATIKGSDGGNTGGDNTGGDNNGGGVITAEAFFASDVHDVIYPVCYSACHQEGGSAPGTGARLVFEGPGANQVDLNYQALRGFIVDVADGQFLLEKISNTNPLAPHTGGAVYSVGSAGYETIKTFTEYFE